MNGDCGELRICVSLQVKDIVRGFFSQAGCPGLHASHLVPFLHGAALTVSLEVQDTDDLIHIQIFVSTLCRIFQSDLDFS